MQRFKKLLCECRKAKVKIGHYSDYADEDYPLAMFPPCGRYKESGTGRAQPLIEMTADR